MTQPLQILLPLLSALAAGSLIGLERTYHGRPAGFRTHALVCLASALLMVVAVYQWQWFTGTPAEAVRIDPTRMAQGIMTGIGFLGAGVIFKEGLTVRGLTTAASIWMTATLGILFGIGFWLPAIGGTLAALGVLGAFRWLETRMPVQHFAHFRLAIPRDKAPASETVRALLAEHGCSASAIRIGLGEGGALCEFRTMIRTTDRAALDRLAAMLLTRADVAAFSIDPTGD